MSACPFVGPHSADCNRARRRRRESTHAGARAFHVGMDEWGGRWRSADAQEMAESGVAAQTLLFEPLTLHDLTIKNRTWLSLMCQHMVTVEDGVGIWCISAHERGAGPG